jgi:hypothetical protein
VNNSIPCYDINQAYLAKIQFAFRNYKFQTYLRLPVNTRLTPARATTVNKDADSSSVLGVEVVLELELAPELEDLLVDFVVVLAVVVVVVVVGVVVFSANVVVVVVVVGAMVLSPRVGEEVPTVVV